MQPSPKADAQHSCQRWHRYGWLPPIMTPLAAIDAAAMQRVEALMHALLRGDAAAADFQPDLLGSIAAAHLRSGGKRLRARLALSAAGALGGAPADAEAWAAACEMLHNATLIHDDLQDGDAMRRGVPTTWVQHGAAQAINAGDLLLMLPIVALAEMCATRPLLGLRLHRCLAHAMVAVIRGQGEDCAALSARRVTRNAYQRTVAHKTAALFELPVRGAAILSGCDPAQVDQVAAPFAPLGVVFQMQDDLLDVFGDKGRGAPGNDLREGKISALVVEHLALQPQDGPWLLALLARPRQDTEAHDVVEATARFVAGGALAAVLAAIDQRASAALHQVLPALQPLLEALMEQVLAPIAHLRRAGP